MGTALGTGVVVLASGSPAADLNAPREFDEFDYENNAGSPVDGQSPSIRIDSPATGVIFNTGDDVFVTVTATDDVAIDRVEIRFDLDGSGAIDQPRETQVGIATERAGEFEATFPNIAGPDGSRDVNAEVFDTSLNVEHDVVAITVPEPGAFLALMLALPLLVLLQRRKARMFVPLGSGVGSLSKPPRASGSR